MPVLSISVNDEAWPVVLAALVSVAGPIPEGVSPHRWAEQVAAKWFQAVVAEALAEPPPPPAPPKRIRPSRVRA